MNRLDIRRSWGIVLLWIFFVPFFSNNLHYVIINHEYGKTHTNNLEWRDGSKVHYCDQYLFKLLPAIQVPSEISLESILQDNFQLIFNILHVFYTSNVKQNLFARGPPSIV